MNLDPRTIIIMNIVSSFMMSVSLFGISRGRLAQIFGIKKWAAATMLQSFGWIVVGALRDIVPDFISVVIGNTLLLLTIALYFKIIAEFENKKVPTGFEYSIVGLEAIFIAYFLLVTPNVAARIATISGFTGLLMLASSFILFSKRDSRPFSHVLTGSFFLICGLLLTIRCVSSLFWDTNPDQLPFAIHSIGSVNYLTFYITSVMLTFGFVLMCNDKYITDRKQMEDDLIDSEEKFSLLAKNATDIISLHDLNLNYVYVSDSVKLTLGFEPEELVGRPISEFIHPEDLEYIINRYSSMHKRIAIEYSQFRHKKKDGSFCWMESSASFTFNNEGKASGLVINTRDITERKNFESALLENEKQINAILKNAPAGVIVINEESVITEWNPMAESIFGWKKEEVIGKYLYETIIPSRFREGHNKGIQHFLKTGEGQIINEDVELSALRKDNSEFEIGINISSTLINNKLFFISFITDISDRKLKELEKQEADTKLRILSKAIEQSPVTIIITDMAGNIQFVNPKFEEITGYTSEEVIGKNPRIFKTNYKSNEEYKELWNTILSGNNWKGIFRNRRKNGELYWESSIISPVKDNDGVITHFLAVREDVTERKKSEDELKNKTTQLNEAQQTSHIGSWEHDVLKNKVTWSDEMYRIFGVDPIAFEGKHESFLKYVHPDDLENINNAVEQCFKDHLPFTSFYRIIRPDGMVRTLEAKGNVFTNEYGRVVRMAGTDQDVTETKLAEQELIHLKEKAESSEKTKDQFLANMSHEIRTPMNAIIGFTDLLRDTKLSIEQKKWLKTIKNAGENLLVIINDILDFSKMEAGKIEFENNRIDIADLIQSSIALLKPSANRKKIKLFFKIDNEIPAVVIGDSVRLTQIALNLIANAIKFTSQGQVDIAVGVVNETDENVTVKFSVTDTGKGIEADKIDSIFESFTQENGDISRKYGGTGLGLTISKKLVEQQGGTISVTSELKKGSCFTFTLPFKKTETLTKVKKTKRKTVNIKSVANLNILVVEDNTVNQQLAKTILSKWEIVADIAGNGKVAIDKLNSKNYDLILMDVQMPEMDGYDTAEYIRGVLNNNTPIIAMTAHAMKGEAEKCFRHGMNDYISKPFDPNDLLAKIIHHTKNIFRHSPTLKTNKTLHLAHPLDTPTLNLGYLKEITANDTDQLLEILHVFMRNMPLQIAALENAMNTNNLVELKFMAHKLKSSVNTIGLTDCLTMLNTIENNLLKKINLDDLPTLVNKITHQCKDALKLLEIEIVSFQNHK